MSRRLMVFKAANIMPQTTCNYTVWIPSIWRSPLAIDSTSLPFKKTISSDIYIRGIKYSIPVKQTSQGLWTCTMAENLFMGSLYQALNKQNIDMYSNTRYTDYVSTFKLGKIFIFITDALTGTAPVAMEVLDDCYLSEISEISLSSTGATDVMKVKLTFQYNGIIDPISAVQNIIGTDIQSDIKVAAEQGTASVAEIQAGVAAITAAAWGVAWGVNKGVDQIEKLLNGDE